MSDSWAERTYRRLSPGMTELWTDGSLVGAASEVASAWIDLTNYDSLRLGKTSAGGAYEFSIDWGRATGVADFTEIVSITEKTTVEKAVGARWVRFRVKNTDGLNAFTAHRTNVFGR